MNGVELVGDPQLNVIDLELAVIVLVHAAGLLLFTNLEPVAHQVLLTHVLIDGRDVILTCIVE